MSLTALEISQRQFKRILRGLDPAEVQAFLGEVASGHESLAREIQQLKDVVVRQGDEVEGYRARERMVHETLVTAQKACDDIREAARREADAKLKEAELQAERIVQSAHTRYQRVLDDVNELKRQRVQLAAQLRSVLRAHEKLLEALGDGERPEAHEPPRRRLEEA